MLALTLTILSQPPLIITLLEGVIPTCRQMFLGVTIYVPENVGDSLSFSLTIFGRGGFVNMCQTLLRERNGRGHSQVLSLETWSWLSTKMPLMVIGIPVTQTFLGCDGQIRVAEVQTKRGTVKHPVVKLCLLEEAMRDVLPSTGGGAMLPTEHVAQ